MRFWERIAAFDRKEAAILFIQAPKLSPHFIHSSITNYLNRIFKVVNIFLKKIQNNVKQKKFYQKISHCYR